NAWSFFFGGRKLKFSPSSDIKLNMSEHLLI
ncbi:MAG: hypothetical protein ACI9JY_002833, partial [Saprospiraceae bacterium]